ncbi:hypothetical protein TNCV_4379501 [Trichonephila clavipes]|nr:hypothetical protein TNCV_4379501 [Trichonephila clavipes]
MRPASKSKATMLIMLKRSQRALSVLDGLSEGLHYRMSYSVSEGFTERVKRILLGSSPPLAAVLTSEGKQSAAGVCQNEEAE